MSYEQVLSGSVLSGLREADESFAASNSSFRLH